jgi:hypothetical protein
MHDRSLPLRLEESNKVLLIDDMRLGTGITAIIGCVGEHLELTI